MKKIVFLLLFLGAFVQTHAVLKEQDLEKTLNILREELTDTHHDQERNSEATKKRNEETIRQLIQTLQRSNQNALMLYSQKEGYVFDYHLSYGSIQGSEQFILSKDVRLRQNVHKGGFSYVGIPDQRQADHAASI